MAEVSGFHIDWLVSLKGGGGFASILYTGRQSQRKAEQPHQIIESRDRFHKVKFVKSLEMSYSR
jgi:hypothetical protein